LLDEFDELISHEFKNFSVAIEDSQEDTVHHLNFFEFFVLEHVEQASALFFHDLLSMISDKFILNDF
jgi:hypothetical protein